MTAEAVRKSAGDATFPAGIDAQALERLKRRPEFVGAVRASAAATIDLYRGSHLLNAILNDRGRFMISSLALYLHFQSRRDPSVRLTAGRLRTLAVRQGACSSGRAAAVIALMQWGGYLVPAPAPAGERSERLTVTGRLLGHMVERWRMQLGVMSRLYPEAVVALGRLHDPDYVAAHALTQAEEFLSGFRFLDHAPELAVFFERNGGFMVLLSLTAQGEGDRRAMPRVAVVSISGLARRFGVSRAHVIAMLRDAEAQGLLERRDDQVVIGDTLADAVERFYALVYLLNIGCIRRALAEAPA